MRWSKRFYNVIKTYGIPTAAGTIAVLGVIVYQRKKEQSPILACTDQEFSQSGKWDPNWDRRQPEKLVKPYDGSSEKEEKDFQNEVEKKKPKATRHLLLIRHGQYNLNGVTDFERILTLLGREQAEYTGKRLEELNKPYTKLISSTMTRAIETTEIIKPFLPKGIEWEKFDVLREGSPIEPDPPLRHWRPEKYQFFQDGSRIESAFRKFFHRAPPEQEKDSYEVIVCHANVIRYFVCRVLQFPPEGWLRMSLPHASITSVVIRPSGNVSIRSLGESGHIPAEKVTFS